MYIGNELITWSVTIFKTESSHMYTNTDQMASSMAMQEKKAVICIEAGDESYRGENRLYIEHNNIYLDRK